MKINEIASETTMSPLEHFKDICDGNDADLVIEERKDGSINVFSDVYIIRQPIKTLPIKINKVEGDFVAKWNNIETLENFPNLVDGDFVISNNPQLRSLEGGPTVVKGKYNVSNCKRLRTLKGIANTIEGDLYVIDTVGKEALDFYELRWTLFSEIQSIKINPSKTPRYVKKAISKYFATSSVDDKKDMLPGVMEALKKADRGEPDDEL